MRALLSSIALPLLSHIARQSYACSEPADASASTSFLVAYALSILVHGTFWIDECVDVEWFRVAVVSAGATFAIAVGVYRMVGPGVWFVVCWTVHAIPSAALWPISFRLVNSKVKVSGGGGGCGGGGGYEHVVPRQPHPLWRAALVVWSLQANVGDAVGCILSPFIFGTSDDGDEGSGVRLRIDGASGRSGGSESTTSWARAVWLHVAIALTFCVACMLPPLESDEFTAPSSAAPAPALNSSCMTTVCLLSAEAHPQPDSMLGAHIQHVMTAQGTGTTGLRAAAAQASARRRTLQATTILVLCGACTKTTSYAASNWMPELRLDYWSYALGNVVGTATSAVVVGAVGVVTWRRNRGVQVSSSHWAVSPSSMSNKAKATTSVVAIAASTALLCLAIVGHVWTSMWSVPEFALAFGVVGAFVSTTLSVCMCADIADECERYGRTSAHADGAATLIAAALQPCARSYFVSTQVGATAALVFTLVLSVALEEHDLVKRMRTLVRARV